MPFTTAPPDAPPIRVGDTVLLPGRYSNEPPTDNVGVVEEIHGSIDPIATVRIGRFARTRHYIRHLVHADAPAPNFDDERILRVGDVISWPGFIGTRLAVVTDVNTTSDNVLGAPYVSLRSAHPGHDLRQSSRRHTHINYPPPHAYTLRPDVTMSLHACDLCATDSDEPLERVSHLYDTYACDDCLDNATPCYSCGEPTFDAIDTLLYVNGIEEWHCTACADDMYCHDCDAHHSGDCPYRFIQNWNYRPDFRFYPHRDPAALYLGFELELEFSGASPDKVSERLYNAFYQANLGYLKHDGSLHNGVELVTMPMQPAWMLDKLPWDAIDEVRRMGARSYNTGTAGMHIHVSRAAFASPAHEWKFLQFHYRNAALCQQVAQRPSTTYANWEGTADERRKTLLYVKKQTTNHDRYVAVNLQNDDTIELRYFKGTLNVNSIKKNVEFATAVFRYTEQLTTADVMAGGLARPAFLSWLSDNRKDYPHLYSFLADRDAFDGDDS